MVRVLPLVVLSACIVGCMSYSQRYDWDRNHVVVCPRARGLTPADLDQIARLVARATPFKVAYFMSQPVDDDSLREIWVDIGIPGRVGDCADRACYGYCVLRKDGREWRLVKYADDVATFLWGGCH